MNLIVQRRPVVNNDLVGMMTVDGEFEAYTMENAELAVPPGIYPIELYDSPKHGPDTPQLIGVPGRKNCQIHVANFSHELEGCIAPGTNLGAGCVEHSKIAYGHLQPRIKAAIQAKQHVTLEIRDAV